MFEIELYAAVAVATAGVCWYFHRRNQGWAALTAVATIAGLLWPILAVGAVQFGLFVALKHVARARRSQPQPVTVGEDAPASTPTPPRTPGPDAAPIRSRRNAPTVERRTECLAALTGSPALASLK